MPEGVKQEDPKLQAEAARKAFEQEFERFARLGNSVGQDSLTLTEAEGSLRSLGDLSTRHTGKKSELASLKKLIGRVAPEERAAFGQLIQSLNNDIVDKIAE